MKNFIENLEERQLFSGCTAALDAYGNLTVNGTAGNDTIAVTEKYGSVTVYDNGTAMGTWSAVKAITVNGLAGGDAITYTGYDFGAKIYGGDGTDTITTTDYEASTAVHTYVDAGAGADKIYVKTAQGGQFHGGLDNDAIQVQGGSNVHVWGDGGTDSITVSAGVTNTTVHKDSNDKISNSGTNTVLTLT